jgi:competence protein ComEC
MGWGIDAVAAIAAHVTAWPGAVLAVPSMPAAGLVLLSVGGLWLCIWQRRWRWLGLAPIAAGALTLLFVRPPDLLISDDAGLIAVRAADGSYLLSKGRGEKFVEETWTRRAAAETGATWPRMGASADGRLSCDAERCVYRARGRVVALLRDGAALGAACAGADLVVSPLWAPGACPGVPVIDRAATEARGGHAVWLDPAGIRIASVADWRGIRLWTPAPKRGP